IADHVMPFSASKAVADFIRKDLPPNITIAAVDDYCGSPVAAYLGRELYFPQMRKYAPFNTQNDAARYPITLPNLFEQFDELILKENRDVLFLLSSKRSLWGQDVTINMPATSFGPPVVLRVKVLPRFEDSTVEDESQALYLIQRVQ